MAKRVTDEDIIKMNNIYYTCRTYAETARQTGFSATTVKKYIISDYQPMETKEVFHIELPELKNYVFNLPKSECSSLSEAEREEVKVFSRGLTL